MNCAICKCIFNYHYVLESNYLETEICEICFKNKYTICSFCKKEHTFYSIYCYFDGKVRHTCFECSKKIHNFKFNDKIIKFHEDDYHLLKIVFDLE